MFIVDLAIGVSMPAATRARALKAAVELVGAEGIRALSHARVDARASLPPGSTSNWFRTRRALLVGIVDWIAEHERADLGPAVVPTITELEELVEGLCAVVELQTGPFAARTRARFALFLELAGDPELGEPLRRQRHEFERWTEQMMIALGIADPERVVIGGWSWGGYITLLALGLHPDRFVAGVAGVPVGDYLDSYDDSAPSLQAYDRSLAGGVVHDIPPSVEGLGFRAPLHALITGRPDERDRQIKLLEAPRFGIVGKDQTIRAQIMERGGTGSALVTVRRDGQVLTRQQVRADTPFSLDVRIEHGGTNVV